MRVTDIQEYIIEPFVGLKCVLSNIAEYKL